MQIIVLIILCILLFGMGALAVAVSFLKGSVYFLNAKSFFDGFRGGCTGCIYKIIITFLILGTIISLVLESNDSKKDNKPAQTQTKEIISDK